MENLKLFNMVSLQKQFDVLTSSLNFFDMSYLISGGAMLFQKDGVSCQPHFLDSNSLSVAVLRIRDN